MVHGYRSCNFYEFAHFALMYLECFGWNVLIVDDYAHGQSDGKYIGFGWTDRQDIHSWTDWLVKRMGTDSRILLHGCSMGAAAVLTAAGEEKLPRQVCAVVADCGFSSLNKFCRDISKNIFISRCSLFTILQAVSVKYWRVISSATQMRQKAPQRLKSRL